MATELTSTVLDRLETLFERGTLVGQTDRRLLDLFATADGPAAEHAFSALVHRHAGMVHRVCQGLLNDSHEAEDATQATFLVLARRARTIRGTESLSSWLYGTARRIALRARRDAIRRDRHEREKAVRTERPRTSVLDEDSSRTLYRELDRLPEIQRTPIVLCYLENLTHEQAAARVGCPIRTFQSRLLRGRQKLQTRLAKQGVGINSALLAIGRGATPLQPTRLDSLAKAAHEFARRLPASHFSQAASHMAQIELTATSWRIATLATTLGLLIAGTATLAFTAWRSRAAEPPSPPLPPPVPVAALPIDDEPDRTNRTLDLRVQERESGKPLAGVAIEVHGDTGARDGFGGDARLIMEGTTDQNGHCRLEFPRELPRRYYIKASHPGYAIRRYAPITEPTNLTIVKSHTMEMEPGITIGGIIKNEDGQPLSNATVSISSRAGAEGSPDFSYVEADVTTDDRGQWRFDGMPSGWEYVSVKVSHPDYVPTMMQRNVVRPSDLMLKARKAETILSAGVSVPGLVLDDRGAPIKGAEVALGNDRPFKYGALPKTTTDADGRFVFGHLPESTQTITVQAPGRSPEFADVVCSKETKPIEFRLGPGHTIRGRVVNQEGKPLDDVTVQAMNWKGHSSLDWKTTTDRDGRFTWDSAPAEPVLLTMTRPGYVMLGQRKFQAGEKEIQVTMLPPQRVHGNVVDARTGKPISRFSVIDGTYYRWVDGNKNLREDALRWGRRLESRTFNHGQYEIEHSDPQAMAIRLKIEADGYLPAISPPYFMDQFDVTFDAKLEPGQGPTGLVLGLDGKPLPNAHVVLSTKSLQAKLYQGKFHASAYPETTTDGQGRFQFPPQPEPYRIFIDHDRGCAEADQEQLEKSPELKIQPWGRVEGTIKRGSKVAAGMQLRLGTNANFWDAETAMPILQGQQISSDERGRFVFERVMPERVYLSLLFTLDRSSNHVGTADRRVFTVEPGKTTFVDLGGTGRPITGRFVLPEGVRHDAVFPYYGQTLELSRPGVSMPADVPREKWDAWYHTWAQTEEGKAYEESLREYDTNVRPDGRFRIEDVGPGKYRLQAKVNEPGEGIPGSYGPELAKCNVEIVVPEIPGGRSDEPLDLGTIELKPVAPPKTDSDYTATLLKPGVQAPGFEVKTVDGKTVRLEDLRGKFVLLDFWATWCGPCVAEIPHLKAAYDAFGKDERLAIVSLSLDKNLDDPRGFAEAHQLKWIQGFLGDWADAKLPEDYGVQAIPAIFLIGPDGKIVQSGLRGDAIKTAIAEAISH